MENSALLFLDDQSSSSVKKRAMTRKAYVKEANHMVRIWKQA